MFAAVLSLGGALLFAGALGVSAPGEWLFLIRFALGVVTLLLLPGFLLLHLWRGEAFRPLEALGLSFGLSMLLLVPLVLTAFALGLPIDAVVIAVVLWNVAGSLRLLAVRSPNRVQWSRSQIVPLLVAAFLTVVYYRWSDDVTHVSWEVGLHLAWARQYASTEPLGADASLVRPGGHLPNVFFLWEFALACVSRVSHLDIVPAFLRARALIPGLGLGALALMARAFFGPGRTHADLSSILALLVVFRSLVLQPWPESFSWLLPEGRFPGFLFGSVHHSDTAMDILLPLLLAALFAFLRTGGRLQGTLLAASLAASFFWHPREYFQVLWYAVIAAALDLALRVAGRRGFAPVKRHFQMGGLLLGVTVMLVAVSRVASASHDSSQELRAKTVLVEAFRERMGQADLWLSAYSPWKAPTAVTAGAGAPKPEPPQVFSFMVLSVLSAAVLARFGRRREAWFAAFVLALWWITLCVPVIQQMLILATYSEVLASQMRFLPTLSFLLVALGLLRGGAALRARFPRTGALAALALGLGWAAFWPREASGFPVRIGVLNALFAVAAGLVSWRLSRRGAGTNHLVLHRPRAAPVGWVALFLCPASFQSGSVPLATWWGLERDPMALFGEPNPSGLSPALIAHFQSRVPARSAVQVFPGALPKASSPPGADQEPSMSMPSIYAAIYQWPLAGNVFVDTQEFREARAGRHPLFSILREDPCAADRLLAVADARGLDFILLQGRYYASAACLAERAPARFFISFDDPQHREALLGLRPGTP